MEEEAACWQQRCSGWKWSCWRTQIETIAVRLWRLLQLHLRMTTLVPSALSFVCLLPQPVPSSPRP